MRSATLRSLVGWAAAAVLAGCGGSKQVIGTPGAMTQSQAPAFGVQAGRGKSWMLPEAKSEALLYAATIHGISIFSYPAGKRVGDLRNGYKTYGLCSDPKGDVFVDSSEKVFEYAHAGTKPIATIRSKFGYSLQCAYDSTTGNLAVIKTIDSGPESVVIYQNVTGRAQAYEDYGPFYSFSDCTYDGSGNLFVTGYSSMLGELPNGGSKFTNYQVSLKSANSKLTGIQWDGTYLVGQETSSSRQGSTLLDRIAITNSAATVVSRTKLIGNQIGFKWLYSGAAIGFEDNRKIGFWPYPAGGKPSKLLTSYEKPYVATTISVAP